MSTAERFVAPHIAEVPPSGIRRFFDIASEMKDAISLGVGEPDFVTPWNIREAAIFSVERGATHYTSNRGLTELRREISAYLHERFNLHYDAETEMMITVGASEALDLAFRAIITPGDEVLIPGPSYVAYEPGIAFASGVPVSIETRAEEDFIITPEALERVITPRTKAVVLPFPNNPTGTIMTERQLRELIPVIEKHDLLVLSDEIYAELTYGREHFSVCAFPEIRERSVHIGGFSKAFAMTGFRLGWACAPKPILDAMLKIHQYTMLSAPTMSQYAGEEAIRYERRNGYQQIDKMRQAYDRRRRFMLHSLNTMGLETFEPRGAFYIFPSIKNTGMSSDEFCERLIREQKVAAVPGTAFGHGGEGFIRCSYATDLDSLREAVRRIGVFVGADEKAAQEPAQ